MPRTAHSIAVSETTRPQAEAIAAAWAALCTLGVKSAGSYTAQQYSDDGEQVRLVAAPQGLGRDGLPEVAESSSRYNHLSYWMWIDAHEFALTIDTRWGVPAYGLLFLADSVKSPGPHWLARACEALLTALGAQVCVLVPSGDEERWVEEARKKGSPLMHGVEARLRGDDGASPPMLAVADADAVAPDLYDIARDAGVRVGMMPSGSVMFSTIHD